MKLVRDDWGDEDLIQAGLEPNRNPNLTTCRDRKEGHFGRPLFCFVFFERMAAF